MSHSVKPETPRPESAPHAAGTVSLRARIARGGGTARDFVRQVYQKADQDNIFFMAGAISFNILVAVIPLILAVVGIAGTVLRNISAEPAELLLSNITANLPSVSPEFTEKVRGVLAGLIDQSAGFIGVGTAILAWFATRLFGTLRTVLREVFDISQGRGIIAGKIFDIKMVLTAGILLIINVALTFALDLAFATGTRILPLTPGQIDAFRLYYGRALAFLVVWVMFLLIYRYLPVRRTQWRIALEAATFTAVLYEIMKQLFSWYVTRVADYSSTYGTLSTLVILYLWIYYSAIAFILGAEIAQVAAMRRVRRRQWERLR